jgi:hypothetical protein
MKQKLAKKAWMGAAKMLKLFVPGEYAGPDEVALYIMKVIIPSIERKVKRMK